VSFLHRLYNLYNNKQILNQIRSWESQTLDTKSKQKNFLFVLEINKRKFSVPFLSADNFLGLKQDGRREPYAAAGIVQWEKFSHSELIHTEESQGSDKKL